MDSKETTSESPGTCGPVAVGDRRLHFSHRNCHWSRPRGLGCRTIFKKTVTYKTLVARYLPSHKSCAKSRGSPQVPKYAPAIVWHNEDCWVLASFLATPPPPFSSILPKPPGLHVGS